MFAPEIEEGDELALLTLDDVIWIHDTQALTEGGLPGVLDPARIESALGRPQMHFDYEGQRDLISLAAVLWHGLSQAHGFTDGNKRTALLAALAFLEANGIEADATVRGDEPGLFVLECFARECFTVAVLDHYLRTRCHWIVED